MKSTKEVARNQAVPVASTAWRARIKETSKKEDARMVQRDENAANPPQAAMPSVLPNVRVLVCVPVRGTTTRSASSTCKQHTTSGDTKDGGIRGVIYVPAAAGYFLADLPLRRACVFF